MRTAAPRQWSRIGITLIIFILIAWCVAMARSGGSSVMPAVMSKFARDIATVLFLSAGVLRAAQWRLSGDAAKAHSAGALIGIGTALAVGSGLYSVVPIGSAEVQAPFGRLILVLPLAALVIVRVRRDRRTMRRCGTAFCAVAVCATIAVLVFAG